MAKKSIRAREVVRKKLSTRFAKKRTDLKEIILSPSATYEAKMEAQVKLQKLPRDSSPSRGRRRCNKCGRPRANLRRFGLCRIHLRELVMEGDVTGAGKASW